MSPDSPRVTSPSRCPIPRGNTLKNIEKECNAKIMIRGKGSVKEGKVGRKDGQMLPGEDEPLHALVTANTMENVKKAVEQVRGCPQGAQGGGSEGATPPCLTPPVPPTRSGTS